MTAWRRRLRKAKQMNEGLLSALSMARGAGKLKIGFDASKDAAAQGAPLVIVASDISERTRRSVEYFCEDSGTRLIEADITQDDIKFKFGWRFGVAAVTDSNFAKLISNKAIQQGGLNDH